MSIQVLAAEPWMIRDRQRRFGSKLGEEMSAAEPHPPRLLLINAVSWPPTQDYGDTNHLIAASEASPTHVPAAE